MTHRDERPNTLWRSACSSMANVTAATSLSSSNGRATQLRFRRVHASARSASSTVASGHPIQNPGCWSLFVMLLSCQSMPSDLEQRRFTSVRAAAPCPWLPAKSRITSMQLSTSTFWRMSTNRVCTELPPPSKAKTLNPALRAEGVTGSLMFALPKGAPNLAQPGRLAGGAARRPLGPVSIVR
jgi:hypothetical protein